MMRATLLLAIALASSIPAFPQDGGHSQAESDKALAHFFGGLYENASFDSPERYAINKIAMNNWHIRAFEALNNPKASADDKIAGRKELGELRDEILLGRNWPIRQHEECSIPYAKLKPELDGNIDSPAWSQALTFRNEFKLNSTDETKSGAVWKMLWSEDSLYVAAMLPDSSITSYEYGKEQGKGPWNGDCLEIFIMPSMRMKTYWEIVITPDNKIFDGLQRNNKAGEFSGCPEEDMAGLRTYASVLRRPDGSVQGFVVMASIPFKELPNYMLGNKPEAGQSIYFSLVRTNEGDKSSHLPLLYDGHNIFCYTKAALAK